MPKLDLRKKMATRKGKAISVFAYKCLMNFVLRPFLKRPMNVEIVDNVGVKNIKEQFIAYVEMRLYLRCFGVLPHKTEFYGCVL